VALNNVGIVRIPTSLIDFLSVNSVTPLSNCPGLLNDMTLKYRGATVHLPLLKLQEKVPMSLCSVHLQVSYKRQCQCLIHHPAAVIEGTKDSVNVFMLRPLAVTEGIVQETMSMSLCFIQLQLLQVQEIVSVYIIKYMH